MCQVDPLGLTCPRNRRCTSGAYVCVQRHTVVWSTDKAPLGRQLFHIPQAELEPKIPPHAGHDNLGSELALPE